MSLSVRRAGADDVPGIARVHLESWRAAYARDAPEGWLDAQTLQGRVDAWSARLHDGAAGPSPTHVVLAQGEIIGFCGVSAPSRDRDADEDTAEIATFYIDPGHWRAGAGRALMDAVLAELARAGWETATLWVLETNDRARAFYATWGFRDDGARLLQRDWPTQIRLRRPLGALEEAA